MTTIGQRKADHLALCAEGDVGFRAQPTLLECVRLVHDALPDMKLSRRRPLRHALRQDAPRAPRHRLDDGRHATRPGASTASSRASPRSAGTASASAASARCTFARPRASLTACATSRPTTLVLGNVGVVQARAMTTSEVRVLADEVGADALCVHLNPAMELVQPGGDRDFAHGLDTIARLVPRPRRAGRRQGDRLRHLPCGRQAPPRGRRPARRRLGRRRHVVGRRRDDARRRRRRRGGARARTRPSGTGASPPAASVALLAPHGLRDDRRDRRDRDRARRRARHRARRLGRGHRAARPARAESAEGRAAAIVALDAVEAELRAAMLLTGSRDLAALRRRPARRCVGAQLDVLDCRSWLDDVTLKG